MLYLVEIEDVTMISWITFGWKANNKTGKQYLLINIHNQKEEEGKGMVMHYRQIIDMKTYESGVVEK